MKKTSYLLLLTFVSCYSITKVTHKKYNYTKNINFFINKVEEIKTISDTFNPNGKWQAKPTDKFVLIDITVINKSNEIKEFDLNDLLLYNYKTDTQYKAEWLLLAVAKYGGFPVGNQ